MTSLKGLLDAFKAEKASDLHLTSGKAPYIRRFGKLVPLPSFPPVSDTEMRDLSMELVGRENFERFQRDNELDMALDSGNDRMRINIYRQQKKIAWALRMLPSRFFPLRELGIPLDVLQMACKLQRGLVLVTGSTGSGKTTTLASIIHEINLTRNCHIFTIEDPIEYLHENIKSFVSQREVGEDTASFEEALRRILREDPDVVMIGEMRDQATIRAALTLAETGHLTFGTLHTSEAMHTITRIIGAFPANEQEQIRTQLALTLNLVISQQLIPWEDGNGRSLASEIMVATPAIKAMIRENKMHQIASSIQTGQQHGMRTMNMSLAELVRQGKLNAEQAFDWSLDKEDMKRLMRSFATDVI